MRWLPLALLTAAAFGSYNVFLKLAAGRVDQLLGAFVLQAVAAGAGAVALGLWWGVSTQPLAVTRLGLGYAALAGLCVGAAEILAFVVFERGAPVTLGAPVILGGSVVFAALGGLVLLREALTPVQGVGVVLIGVGIALLSSGRV
jgi:bacterial/archaeal transporter family protein